MNVISNLATVASISTTLAKAKLGWTGALYTNARQPPNQGVLHRLGLSFTVTAGSPTTIDLQGYWDDTPNGAPVFVAEDIPLKLGPINADHRVCTVLIDAEYEMPKAGSAPNSSTDGLYLWCRTDTGTVSLLYAELTILDMNEAG